MSRGLIEIPLEKGRKELSWYAGRAVVNGLTTVNPVIPLKVERDADFLVKRLWLTQWPSFTGGAYTVDPNLSMPAQTTVILRDGGTKRGLALVAGNARTVISDVTPAKAAAQWVGLASPFLIKANNNLFAEIANPGAVALPWSGDLFLVAEGFKIYPFLPEEIPATVRGVYAVPYDLNANATILSPAAAAANIAGQFITITNGGDGKFLAKGFRITIIDAAGVDKTAALLPTLGFEIVDSTSGNKRWIQDTTNGASTPVLPVSILNMHGSFFGFNTPRYIDPNGVIQMQVIWSDIAAAVAYAAGAATYPLTFSVTFFGALMPR